MLITLPENKNTGKTISTVHSLKDGGGVCRAASQPCTQERQVENSLRYEAAKSGLILKTVTYEVLIFVI